MKRLERILLKLIMLQFIFLITAQYIVAFSDYAPYVKKIVYYEGVLKDKRPQIVETIKLGE